MSDKIEKRSRNYDTVPEHERFKLKPKWGRSNDEQSTSGNLFDVIIVNNRAWALVKFDDDDEPELFKAEGIEVEEKVYRSLV